MPLPGNSSALPLSYAPFELLRLNFCRSFFHLKLTGILLNLPHQCLRLISHVKSEVGNVSQVFQHRNDSAFPI